jgi:hypothetical protein
MYFIMEEDKRITNRIKFRDIESNIHVEIVPEEYEQVNDITVLFMLGNKDSIYPDVIETPVFLVSDHLKCLIEPYDVSVIYRRVALNQIKESIQKNYWILMPEKIECLHDDSEWHPNGLDKKIILDQQKIGDKRIFRTEGMHTPKVIVHIDVSEGIMRRDFEGINFRQVEAK